MNVLESDIPFDDVEILGVDNSSPDYRGISTISRSGELANASS
jgi:hypothetical protein